MKASSLSFWRMHWKSSRRSLASTPSTFALLCAPGSPLQLQPWLPWLAVGSSLWRPLAGVACSWIQPMGASGRRSESGRRMWWGYLFPWPLPCQVAIGSLPSGMGHSSCQAALSVQIPAPAPPRAPVGLGVVTPLSTIAGLVWCKLLVGLPKPSQTFINIPFVQLFSNDPVWMFHLFPAKTLQIYKSGTRAGLSWSQEWYVWLWDAGLS